MSDIVIRAEGLGKRYRRGLTGPPETLRDALTRVIKSPLAAMRRPTQEYFWALRDVGLEVRHGEVLGLIGRNGAGKTTLLKVLSRITRPTTGWAEIHGRVRSLLEVGTGFHGELSGRENTYLSGSILGMGKREIDRKFDEIVAFAEVDKFIDTPVKHYSSGMYVRLAFAVAAHLTALRRMCTRAIWLEGRGSLDSGDPGKVIDPYLQKNTTTVLETVWPDDATA